MPVKQLNKFRIKFRYEETGEADYYGTDKNDAVKSFSQHLNNIGTDELDYIFHSNNVVIKEVEEVKNA